MPVPKEGSQHDERETGAAKDQPGHHSGFESQPEGAEGPPPGPPASTAGSMMNESLGLANINPAIIQEQYRIQYPHLTDDQVVQATRTYIMQVTSGLARQQGLALQQIHLLQMDFGRWYQAELARARASQAQRNPGVNQAGKQNNP